MQDEACLSYLQKYRKDVRFDVLLKCWELPYSVTQHSSHCGSHSSLVEVLCSDPTFRKTMQACQSKVDLLFQEQQDTVRVACCDSQGMYRSVAVATILQGVFKVNGYTTKGPYHLDKCKWKKDICSNCRRCLPNAQKQQLYEKLASC